ncbi:hypothetical protein WAJ14_20610, partial [Acinetobacter baumannii]
HGHGPPRRDRPWLTSHDAPPAAPATAGKSADNAPPSRLHGRSGRGEHAPPAASARDPVPAAAPAGAGEPSNPDRR